MDLNYTPPPTVDAFMSSEAIVRALIGPLGSGKSMGCIMEMLRRSRGQAPDPDGIRRTRWSITRNTLPQIKQTCLSDIEQYITPLVNFKVSETTIFLDFPLDDGTRVKSEWLLVPLERPADVRKLLSLQLTGAWIEEFREIDYGIISPLLGRVGRYPSKAVVPPTWQGIIMSSNPFSRASTWFKHLVQERPDDWAFFKQPGGLSAQAENVANLPYGYYERLMDGASEQFIKAHVHGDYADDLSGQTVFGSSFDMEYHVVDGPLQVSNTRPLMLSIDFGRSPACLICQTDPRGRLIVFEELLTSNLGLEQFVTEVIKPALGKDRYVGVPVFAVGDPAGIAKSQMSEENAFDVLKRLGIRGYPAGSGSNDIAPRLRAVEELLLRRTSDGSAILIERTGCPTLIKAMAHEYRYKRKKGGELEDKPEKLHPISDVADALQYACLSINMNLSARHMSSHRTKSRPKVSVRGWT